MTSFKPIIVTTGRRKDGTFPVYIRVTHHGRTRRIPTSLVCSPSDLTRSLKIKSATVLERGAELCRRMRATLADLSPFTLDEWDVERVVAHIRAALAGETFRLDFFAFGENYAATKGPSTARSYTGALNAFARFLGRRSIDVNDISRQILLDFVEHVEAEPKMHRSKKGPVKTDKEKIPGGASARHIMKLANIFDAAKARYNDEDAGRILIPRSPFDRIPRTQPRPRGQRALPDEVLVALFTDEGKGSMERGALDAFALSFLLMGANMADLHRAEPFTGGVWEYHRKKTEARRADGAEMRVDLPPEAEPFIASLRSRGEGRRWWLPVLHCLGKDADACTHIVNKALKGWAERNGFAVFTFYAARHSWATIARRMGVEKATVDECLCHKGDYALADIYAERAWSLMTAANRRVVDYLYDKIRGLSST